MRTMLVVLVLGTVAASVTGLAGSEDACDPYPIGYCGEYQRQTVVFCYYVVDGRYVSATETDVTVLALPPTALSFAPQTLGYVWQRALDAVVADPAGGPHDEVLFLEVNGVSGLQVAPFRCAQWTWFAEVESGMWLGPFGSVSRAPDETLPRFIAAGHGPLPSFPALPGLVADPVGTACGLPDEPYVWADALRAPMTRVCAEA